MTEVRKQQQTNSAQINSANNSKQRLGVAVNELLSLS